MPTNYLLKAERDKRGWSQAETADRISAGEVSYYRWETLGVIPTHYYRRALARLFGKSIEELGLLPGGRTRRSSAILSKDADLDGEEIDQTVSTNLFLRLCSIMSESDHECRSERYACIIEEHESMNTHNELAAAMTRREAVTALALLPFSPPLSLAKESVYTLTPSQHDLFLQEVGAAFAACEDLANSDDPRDIALVFRVCSRYLAELKEIAKSSSKERMRALELACRCAILRADLGWGCVGDIATLPLAREAVEIAQGLDHIELHLSALSKLAWTYVFVGDEALALRTAEQAKALLERYNDPLPLCIYGGTWSTLSVVQARNFLDPAYAIKRAGERGSPGNKILYGMQFTEPYALQEQGLALGVHMAELARRWQPILRLLIGNLWRSSPPSRGYSLSNHDWTRSCIWLMPLSQERLAIWLRLFATGNMWLATGKRASIERAKLRRFTKPCALHSQARSE